MNTPLVARRLEYFTAVAEELHFGRAAQRLFMAQPALSQQIRQLETDLDLTLFDRTTRRVALTAAGEALLPHVRRLLVSAEGVARVADELHEGARGLLRVGFIDSTAFDLVPRFLHNFRAEWPEIGVELRTMSSDEQATALVDGEIDIGIARTVPVRPAVDSAILGYNPLVVAIPGDHPLATNATVNLAELVGDRFVGFSREVSPSHHGEIRALLARYRVGYDPAIEATEYTTIVGLVAAGNGVALVPASVQRLRFANVVYVPAEEVEARVSLVRLTRLDEPRAIVAHAVTELSNTVDST